MINECNLYWGAFLNVNIIQLILNCKGGKTYFHCPLCVQFKRWLSCIILFQAHGWNFYCQFFYSFTEQMYESNSNENGCIKWLYSFYIFFFTLLNTYPPTIHQCRVAIAEAFVGWSHYQFCTTHCSCQFKSGFDWVPVLRVQIGDCYVLQSLVSTVDVGGFLWTVIAAAVPVRIQKCIILLQVTSFFSND